MHMPGKQVVFSINKKKLADPYTVLNIQIVHQMVIIATQFVLI